MIFTVVKKEFTELMRDGRFRWSALIVFALLVVSLVVGWQHSVVMNEERAAAQDISRRQWVELPAMNPHSAAHYSIFAFKPVAPLALADTGIDPFSGVAVWLEAHSQNEATYSAARDSTAAGRFGQLTAATVLQILIPLVIILLTFAAFAGEREQGTLRQVLSSGAARSQLAFGKVLGAALALAVILVPAVVFGAAALALSSETVSFALNLTRFSILVLAYS
ncbi:MAG: ABC transporter permease, partial [Blastocatellia bacterium]